jgi:hypothetical protein
MPTKLTDRTAWKELEAHYRQIRDVIFAALRQDPGAGATPAEAAGLV